ncbi:hypothetical protein SAMN06297144_1138 [Sphingomonas guangdongensis]|uniref:O-Antigen ligase n=1 Tax=Sphingomonas guangdongensis TaxID=1141890 RepID=A0A285QF82_9SPHN|nr:hypothetical protein [Sphingomonas guangdongensis]SOB80590.1 hypothetical protein SAMN06297144_1138 [Sphingomonas guangdongensis]
MTDFARQGWTAEQGRTLSRPAGRSLYDFRSDGLVAGIFFRVLLLVAPIQSILLTPVQGSTPAYLLVLLCPLLLIANDQRYFQVLSFFAIFTTCYIAYLVLSLSSFAIDQPDMSRLTVIRDVRIFGYLRQTHVTQGVYLLAALGFYFLVYKYWQESFLKYAYYGIMLLSVYGFYEFVFYAMFHINGDFLSNRNFGDLETAAAGAGENLSVTGSRLQTSNLFGAGYMRLKSLTAEPSMYALSVTPFAVYAYGRRWWLIFMLLAMSLALSTSTTAVIGLGVGMAWIEARRRPETVLYLGAAIFTLALLYATADPVRTVLDTLAFGKLDTISGNERLAYFWTHSAVPFDGNPVRALFGLGFGTVRSGDMLSNLLANVGLVGVILYSALMLAPCFLLKDGDDSLAVVATLLATFSMVMLTVPEYGYLPPWFMLALAYVRVQQQRARSG